MFKVSLENVVKSFLYIFHAYGHVKEQREEAFQKSALQIKYKISSTSEEYRLTGKLLIQSREGSAYVTLTPNEICGDRFILSHLHPLDVMTITKLASEKENKSSRIGSSPRFKILKQTFSEKAQLTVYTLYDFYKDTTFEISEEALVESKEIQDVMAGNDGIAVGFSLGVNHIKNTHKKINSVQK
jgi:hypothetical protein